MSFRIVFTAITRILKIQPRIVSIRRYESLLEALTFLHRGPISTSLAVFPELTHNRGQIYRGPEWPGSSLLSYHAVNMVRVLYIKGEPVALCKLCDGTDIGIGGYVFVSLAIVFMVLDSSVDFEKTGCVYTASGTSPLRLFGYRSREI